MWNHQPSTSLKFTVVIIAIGVFIEECRWGIQQEFPTNLLWVWVVLQRDIKDLFFSSHGLRDFTLTGSRRRAEALEIVATLLLISLHRANEMQRLIDQLKGSSNTSYNILKSSQDKVQVKIYFPFFPFFFSFLPQATIFKFLTVTIFDLILTEWWCEPNVAHFFARFFWNVCDMTSTFAVYSTQWL